VKKRLTFRTRYHIRVFVVLLVQILEVQVDVGLLLDGVVDERVAHGILRAQTQGGHDHQRGQEQRNQHADQHPQDRGELKRCRHPWHTHTQLLGIFRDRVPTQLDLNEVISGVFVYILS
jgi:hypothetical protein